MRNKYPEFLNIIKLDTCDSTNDYLKKNFKELKNKFPIMVSAQSQTKGKGRNNRTWFSKKNTGLYSSFGFILKVNKNLNFLPLIAGISVIETLNKIGNIECGLKWPNDVLYNNRKISGVLIENIILNNIIICISGIGINLNHSIKDFPVILKKTAISLKMITKREYKIEKINIVLANHFFKWLNKLKNNRVETIIKKSNQFSEFLRGKEISFNNNNKKINSIYQGINKNGGLILKDSTGNKKILFTGEIHL